MKLLMLVLFIIFTFSVTRADTRSYETACTQLAFELISKKMNYVHENNRYLDSLNRLDKSLSELSKKKPIERAKLEFRTIPPVFTHATDVMTVNYMSRILKMVHDTQIEDKKEAIKNVAINNLAAEYKKLIPQYMNNCVNKMIENKRSCAKAKSGMEKLSFCYSDNLLATEEAKLHSPFFQEMQEKGITL